MTGLDTNVLVRYIMQDDARQAAKANALIDSLTAEAPGFVSLVCVVELAWVLSSGYGLERPQVGSALELLLKADQLVVEQHEPVSAVLLRFKDSKADFADSLIQSLCTHAGCERTLTFDKGAAKAAGMVLVA